MRLCPGGRCELRESCKRWLPRAQYVDGAERAERFTVAPYTEIVERRFVDGRVHEIVAQRCEFLIPAK